jgi:hypothetical protein
MAAGQFGVGIQALRDDAKIWDQQGAQMQQIVTKANGLRMDRLEAGIFQVYVSAYQQACDQVVNRSGEGATAMHSVSTTLTGVADAYQQDEVANTHKFTDLH